MYDYSINQGEGGSFSWPSDRYQGDDRLCDYTFFDGSTANGNWAFDTVCIAQDQCVNSFKFGAITENQSGLNFEEGGIVGMSQT